MQSQGAALCSSASAAAQRPQTQQLQQTLTAITDHVQRICYCQWEESTCLVSEITLGERRQELFCIVADAPPLMVALNLAPS